MIYVNGIGLRCFEEAPRENISVAIGPNHQVVKCTIKSAVVSSKIGTFEITGDVSIYSNGNLRYANYVLPKGFLVTIRGHSLEICIPVESLSFLETGIPDGYIGICGSENAIVEKTDGTLVKLNHKKIYGVKFDAEGRALAIKRK